MATYREILASETDAESPVTTTLMTALAQNVLAIIEGDATAPRIIGNAAATVGDGLSVLTVTATDDHPVGYGATPVLGTLETATTTVTAFQYTIFGFTGDIRFNASHQLAGNISFESTLTIRLNGSSVASWDTSSVTPVARSMDISVVPGDVIDWRHSVDGGASTTSIVSSVSATASDSYVEAPLYIKASEV